MRYARIQDNCVAEIVELEDLTPLDVFHPEIAEAFVAATDGVEANWSYDGKKFSPPAPMPTIDNQVFRTTLKADVDSAAETERLKYITPGNGQAMTYQQKVTEAQAFKAATNPKASDYPILSSEVGITAQTLAEVADIVLAAFAQWQQIGAAIEVIRLGAKRDIDAAEDETAARAVVDAIVWP